MKLEGIYTPVITPFDQHGEIDYEGLAQLLEALVEAGVHGVISGGSTGENYAQTVDERQALARFSQQQLQGRIPLIVGTCSCQSRKEKLSYAKRLQADACPN